MAKLLVVDDLKEIHDLLGLLLENKGFEILNAYNGDEGIEVFRSNPADVVLTDIRMPYCDGIDMIMELQSIDPDVVAVVMTGFESPANLKRALKVRAFDFVTKPYNARKIMTVLESALQERMKRRLKSTKPPSAEDEKGFREMTRKLRNEIARYQEMETKLREREEQVNRLEAMAKQRQQFINSSEAIVERKMNELIVKETELEQLLEDINKLRGQPRDEPQEEDDYQLDPDDAFDGFN